MGHLCWHYIGNLQYGRCSNQWITHKSTLERVHHRYAFNSESSNSSYPLFERGVVLPSYDEEHLGSLGRVFRLGRHLMQAVHYRLLRTQAFQVWKEAVCA